MSDSVFTKIIKGEIPSYKIYEDDKTLAFLDIHPKVDGHVLVVPKKQINQFQALPDDDYISLMRTVKKVALRLQEVLRPKRIGLQVVGIDVPHTHIHVFPFNNMEEYHRPQDMTKEPDHDKLAEMAKKLAF
ncbi:MAG: Histidine triad (HIT) protein [Parcubacteria group bacterium GW2011_GWA2_49_16]|nr:MAG: Histidine triad (HIT) protein [Parcubacteria group bacterium GW2011_GWA2_49_16]